MPLKEDKPFGTWDKCADVGLAKDSKLLDSIGRL
jgi:hypothetical protein